jgi:TolB protein
MWAFRFFILVAILLVVALAFGALREAPPTATPIDPTLAFLSTQIAQPPTASATTAPPETARTPMPTLATIAGSLIYSARGAGHSHLWAISQGEPAAFALTSGDYDDREPAVSPDGQSVAFASNRSGGWDLFLLDLRTGAVRPLTQTPAFEGHPTWSPDGLWIAYEAYDGSDLDIWVLRVDGTQDPIQLTNAPSMDASPVWDPAGRRIAFTSDRDGLPDVYVANLDNPDERYLNLSNTPLIAEAGPVFSPDGSSIAYSGRGEGLDFIYLVDLNAAQPSPREIGIGRWPEWSPDGDAIGAVLPSAQTTHFVIYPLVNTQVTTIGFPPLKGIDDFAWVSGGVPQEVAAWTPQTAPPASEVVPIVSSERVPLVRMNGVDAPTAMLSERVESAFADLRARAREEAGWDVLASLDNAFVGINAPMPPGYEFNDWLYTGRAFALDSADLSSGLLEVVREDFGAETYWRVYVRTAAQDGSMGEPMRVRPWDFTTRYTGDPTTYDRGGSLKTSVPQGYFVDLTQLASDSGFDRVPAMSNWRTFFPAARYNEFARTGGLTWEQAMLEIYPPEAIVTPTPYLTPTNTPTITPRPTATPWWWRWILTATAQAAATPTPTWTPAP